MILYLWIWNLISFRQKSRFWSKFETIFFNFTKRKYFKNIKKKILPFFRNSFFFRAVLNYLIGSFSLICVIFKKADYSVPFVFFRAKIVFFLHVIFFRKHYCCSHTIFLWKLMIFFPIMIFPLKMFFSCENLGFNFHFFFSFARKFFSRKTFNCLRSHFCANFGQNSVFPNFGNFFCFRLFCLSRENLFLFARKGLFFRAKNIFFSREQLPIISSPIYKNFPRAPSESQRGRKLTLLNLF